MAVICLHCMTRFYLLPEGGASPLRSLRHIEELQRCAHGIAASCIGLLCNVVSCEPHYLRAQLLRRDLPLRLSVLRSCHRLLCDGSARMQHRTSSCLLIATCIHIDRGTWGTRTLAPHPELAAGLATATLGLAERHGVASAGEGFPAAQHALEAVVAVSDSGKAALAASKAFERWVALFDAGRRGQQQQQQQGHHRSTAGAATDAPTHPGGTPGPAVPELVLLRLASVFTALLASFTPPAAGEDAAPPPPLVPPGALWPVTLGRALRHHLAACLPPAAAAAAAGQRKGGGGGGGGGVSPALLHRVEVGLLRLTRAYLLAGVAGESGAPILQEVLDAFLRVRVSPVGISPTALALLECVGCCGGSGKLLSLMRGKGRGAEVAASLGAMVSEAVVSGNAVWGVPLAKALAEVSFSEAGQAWVAEIPGVWECVFGTPQEPQRLYDAAPLHVMTMLRNMCFLKGNKLRLVRNADFVGLLSENLVTANPSLLAVQLKWLSASAVWALVYNMERAKQQLRPLIQPFLVDAAELTAKHLQVEQRTLGGLRLAGETEAEGSELLSMLSECLQQIETLAMLFE